VWLGICDGNMQEGSFRCDANVSVRKPGQPFGTRREIKNLNSFKFLQQAIDFEVQWQIDRLEDGLKIEQATVLFNPDTGETRAMRSKEDAHDYRYFPDPDLPPLVIAPDWVERVRAAMPELPGAMAARFERDDGLSAYDAAMMAQSLPFARYYEAVRDQCRQPKLAANWVMGELSRRLNAEGREIGAAPVPAASLATLIARVADSTVSNNGARQVFEALWSGQGSDVDALIAAKGLKQSSDTTSTIEPGGAPAHSRLRCASSTSKREPMRSISPACCTCTSRCAATAASLDSSCCLSLAGIVLAE
jgi:aspartyl-tRNA(Asn)/glutamyl-tRNA(Gln) amidotransferase subunit B